MMFGFGDSHKPNPDTVRLVENIVLQQLRLVVQEALKFAENGKPLKPEHLIFLMRKNKFKMCRFIKYLQNKDLRKKAENQTIDLTDQQKNFLIDFIERIDETGELTDITEFDEVKYERQLRADRISIALDEEKYMKFFKARCASFNSKQMSRIRNFMKLKEWVDPKGEVEFTSMSLDVLSYYAYETVAQLTDYALLVRMDMKSTSNHLSDSYANCYNASMFNGEFKFSGKTDYELVCNGKPPSNPDYSKVCTGQPPISVNEIKEVMRRIHMPQSGKLYFGKRKAPESPVIIAL